MHGIYIHIPYCTKKCFYCDFYSITDLSGMDEYISCLTKEISSDESKDVSTVYLGGGTPSLMKVEHLQRIFSALHDRHLIKSDAEITIEANPGTLNLDILSEYEKLGINRLSIGIQSFVDRELKFLQRIHNAEKAEESLRKCIVAGFENITIDLIFSVPGQSMESWAYSLKKAIDYKIPHISAYSLTYEPGTPLHKDWVKGKVKKTNEELDNEMYFMTMDLLESNDYEHYEISSYAKQGYKCRHNINYWNGGSYTGYGTAAHSYDIISRNWNVSNIKKYISLMKKSGNAQESKENLTENDMMKEKIFLSIRQGKLNIKNMKIGAKDDLERELDMMIRNEYIRKKEDHIFLTKKGYSIADEISIRLISIAEK